MTLFSWFYTAKKVNNVKNTKENIDQELSKLSRNTMWPIATVRNNTILQQQNYINTQNIRNEPKAVTPLREQKT